MKLKSFSTLYTIIILLIIMLASCMQAPQNEMPVTTNSDKAKEMFYQGRELLFLGDYDDAVVELKKAVELDENFALAYLYLDLAFPSTSDSDKYRRKYLDLADQVTEAEALLLKTFQLDIEGKGVQAKENIQKLYEMYPADPILPYLFGFYFYWNDDNQFLDLMNKSIGIDPDFPHAYYGKGLKYATLKDFEQAEKAYTKYAELLPGEANPVVVMARMYREQGDMGRAINMYENALTIDPGHTYAIPGIGNCHLFLGNYNEGRKYFQQWYETGNIYSEKSGALFSLATSYLYEDDIDAAVTGFDRYIAFAEENNEPVDVIWGTVFKGYILLMNERIEEGIDIFRQGIEMIGVFDMDEDRRNNLVRWSHFWESIILSFEGNMEGAWEEYGIFKKLEEERTGLTENKSVYGTYAWLKQMEGKFQEAIEGYEKASDDAFNWMRIAESYEGLGDIEKAKEYYRKVAETYLNTMQIAMYRNKALAKLEEL